MNKLTVKYKTEGALISFIEMNQSRIEKVIPPLHLSAIKNPESPYSRRFILMDVENDDTEEGAEEEMLVLL